MVAGTVGVMARRDDLAGYGEMADAAPAPLGCRVAGRALAAGAVTVVFALTPALAVWMVTAFVVPDAFSLFDPLLYFGLLLAPSLLEICALVLLAHAFVRHAGAAHAVGIIGAFFVVVNNELGVVTYPPAQFGVPPHVTLSEFTGWAPWLTYALTADAFKLAIAGGIVALAWLAWPRGVATTLPDRWRAGARRLAGGAGALAAASAAAAIVSHDVLHEQLVTRGGYQSATAATADDAAWEARWWREAAAFAVAGGEAEIAVDPAARSAAVRWRLDGVRATALHGALPDGAAALRATVDGRAAEVTSAFDHFAVPLGPCGTDGCAVELALTVRDAGWPAEGESPWLHPSGVWLRAADVLPTLGHDPDRRPRAPRDRRAHRLPDAPAVAPAAAVAPAGRWEWTVRFDGTPGAVGDGAGTFGARTAAAGRTTGPLDFAAAWWPGAAAETRAGDLAALHGPARARDAGGVLDDVAAMRACVAGALGGAPAVDAVLQAPRERGATALHGRLLWLPEHEGWDLTGEGFGRWRRRATIAAALAARQLTDGADLRKEPGADWLRVGVAGWVGLECVRQRDGGDAWLALLTRASDRVVGALGALDAPAVSVADNGDAPWMRQYTPLATAGWGEAVGPDAAARAVDRVVAGVRAGTPLADALVQAAGADAAAALLGPPASSDVMVARTGRTLDVGGQRWRWRDGGWEPLSVPVRVTQRYGDGGRRLIGPVPTTVEPDAPFTLLDAWPSFERSPADNVWRGDD